MLYLNTGIFMPFCVSQSQQHLKLTNTDLLLIGVVKVASCQSNDESCHKNTFPNIDLSKSDRIKLVIM